MSIPRAITAPGTAPIRITRNSSSRFCNGFRAQVKYQSGSTVQYQSVLIKDHSFRIGDSKFTLSSAGKAQIRTVITDPATGNTSLITGTAAQET